MKNISTPITNSFLPEALSKLYKDLDQKQLEEELFDEYPEICTAVAWHRRYGVPKLYSQSAELMTANPHQVFFESNLSKQYTGNPRYLYEAMLEKYPDLDYIWCYSGNYPIPGNPKIIKKRGSKEYYKLLASSGLAVNNTTFPIWFMRKETFFLQTWHGTPLKKLHWDIELKKRKSSLTVFAKTSGWNALLSPNYYSTQKFKSCFRYTGPIIETGYPANDIFSNRIKYEKKRLEVRSKLGTFDDSKKLILYAPTWRDKNHLGNYMFKFDLLLDLDEALTAIPEDYIFLIRTHHMSESKDLKHSFTKSQKKQVIDVSEWDDAVELMCAADLLVTDYSSIVYDWACSEKPVVYYTPDIEEYGKILRGMYYDIKDLNAGPITYTTKTLCTEIINSFRQNYKISEKFKKTFCTINDGNSTNRVIQYLNEKVLKIPE